MNIKEFFKKYTFLSKAKDVDYWELHGNYILKHDAVTKIANYEKIELVNIETILSTDTSVRFLITMKDRKGKQVTTVGEASKSNCKNMYYGAMAEKRGIDRAVLKLINAYEYGFYSEAESDDFKKTAVSNNEPTTSQKKLIKQKCNNLGLDYDDRMVGITTKKLASELIEELITLNVNQQDDFVETNEFKRNLEKDDIPF
jgi:hypothetical protein